MTDETMSRVEFKAARLDLGLTQARWASVLGCSTSSVCAMEHGQRRITPATAYRVRFHVDQFKGRAQAEQLCREMHDRLVDEQQRHRLDLEAELAAAQAVVDQRDAVIADLRRELARVHRWREMIEWLYLPADADFGRMALDPPPEPTLQ